MRGIRVGGQIFVIVIGLILALAITGEIPGVDLNMIGWIVAGAGVVWLILDLSLNRARTPVTRQPDARGRHEGPRSEDSRRGP